MVIAVPPPPDTVEVAAVATVNVKVSRSTYVIWCSAFNSVAGIPPTATAPLMVTKSLFIPP